MALLKDETAAVLKQYQRSELDTGSSEVQVALLTARIKKITDHFKENKHDKHGQRGLIKMVNRRRKLLDYLKTTKPEVYTQLITDLGLRK